jgi:predicted nucleic acid-binding protein
MSSAETPLAVTDTHALIWAATGNLKRLGKAARRIFERAGEGQCSIYIPSIALVELGEACHRGTVAIGTSVSFETSRRPLGLSANTAETHRMESTQKLAISPEKNAASIDRRLSVAPMMDWIDLVQFSC